MHKWKTQVKINNLTCLFFRDNGRACHCNLLLNEPKVLRVNKNNLSACAVSGQSVSQVISPALAPFIIHSSLNLHTFTFLELFFSYVFRSCCRLLYHLSFSLHLSSCLSSPLYSSSSVSSTLRFAASFAVT